MIRTCLFVILLLPTTLQAQEPARMNRDGTLVEQTPLSDLSPDL